MCNIADVPIIYFFISLGVLGTLNFWVQGGILDVSRRRGFGRVIGGGAKTFWIFNFFGILSENKGILIKSFA